MARKGLPKSIIKKYGISKKAWSVYRGSKSRKVTKTKKRKPKRRVTRIARRRKRRRGGKSITTTAFKLVRLGALAAPALEVMMGSGTMQGKINEVIGRYTGYHPGWKNFDAGRLMSGWTPFIMASVLTYGIPKINGIIRRL